MLKYCLRLWLHAYLLLLSKRGSHLLHGRALNLPRLGPIRHHDRCILELDCCEDAVWILPELLLRLLLDGGLLLHKLGLALHHWHPDELLLRLPLDRDLNILDVLRLRLLKLWLLKLWHVKVVLPLRHSSQYIIDRLLAISHRLNDLGCLSIGIANQAWLGSLLGIGIEGLLRLCWYIVHRDALISDHYILNRGRLRLRDWL